MENQNCCSYWKCANRVGLFFLIIFVICFAWYFINTAEREAHLAMWRIAFLGLQEMNFAGFILGAIQTYIWAYIVVGAWYLVSCGHKCEMQKK